MKDQNNGVVRCILLLTMISYAMYYLDDSPYWWANSKENHPATINYEDVKDIGYLRWLGKSIINTPRKITEFFKENPVW